MKAVCPSCGFTFNAQVRAKTGEGTRRGSQLRKLSRNHIQICWTLKKLGPSTVHQIAKALYIGKSGFPLKFQRKDGTEKNWGYHDTQQQLSILVGAHLVSMSSPNDERYNWNTTSFEVEPTPKYSMSNAQIERFAEMLKMKTGVVMD